MGQCFKLIDLDAESCMAIGKFGESYNGHYDWLIDAVTVYEDNTIGKGSRVGHRFICLGDYSSDIPPGLFGNYELGVLKSSHIGSKDLYRAFSDFSEWRTNYEKVTQHCGSRASMVLLNISKNEYITQISVDELYEKFRSYGYKNSFSMGNVLLSRICWSRDPSMSMPYHGFKHESGLQTLLNRGIWAGDRFAYRSLTEDECPSHKDVSHECCLEIMAIWVSDSWGDGKDGAHDIVRIWGESPSAGEIWGPAAICRKKPHRKPDYDSGIPVETFDIWPVALTLPYGGGPRETLPAEIMARIFEEVAWSWVPLRSTIETFEKENSNCYSEELRPEDLIRLPSIFAIVTCSQVCKAWRSVAFQCASLWRYIDSSDDFKQTLQLLERSRDALLDIYIADGDGGEVFWNIIAAEAHRWRHFRIQDGYELDKFSQKFTSLSSELKNLTFLRINRVDLSGDQLVQILKKLPSIKSLTLQSGQANEKEFVPPEEKEPLPSLQVLRLIGLHPHLTNTIFLTFTFPSLIDIMISYYVDLSSEQLVEILKKSSSIKSLTLGKGQANEKELVPPATKEPLPSLQSLRLIDLHPHLTKTLFFTFTFPSLIHITISGKSYIFDEDIEVQAMETVTSLTVGNIKTKKFSALFQAFPNVSAFGLRNTSTETYKFLICKLQNHIVQAGASCTCGKRFGWSGMEGRYILDKPPKWLALDTVKFNAPDPALKSLEAFIHNRKRLGVPLKRMLVGEAGIFNGRIKWMKDRIFKDTSIEIDRWTN